MGHDFMPKYRIEWLTVGNRAMTNSGWDSHLNGLPTEKNFKAYVKAMMDSMKPGGCNEQAAITIAGAKLVNQLTHETIFKVEVSYNFEEVR